MVNKKVEITVISDVHLGTFGSHAEEVLIYLDSINPEVLIINGDLVDIWQFRKRYFPKSHLAVLQKVFQIAASGKTVYFIPGNHDDLIRKFGDFSIGNLHFRNELVLEINNQKVWIHHGDKYDKTVRNQSIAAFGGYFYEHLILLEKGINWMLNKMNIKSLQATKKLKAFSKSMSKKSMDFEAKAIEEAIEKQCDVMICGHTHNPKKQFIENENGKILYLNSGDWVEHLSALEYNNEQWEVIHFAQVSPTIDKITLPTEIIIPKEPRELAFDLK